MAKKKAKKKFAPLDGIFHYADKGGTFAGEIVAGLTMAFLSVCGMFVNMQLIASLSVYNYYESTSAQVAYSGEVYAMTWLAAMIVAFVGTLVMGIVARRPFVQVTSLSLSTVLVSTVSLNTGLTYYNMLAICFVANVIYLIVVAVPQLRKLVIGSIPAPVRAALPAAAGLLMAFVAGQLAGVFQVSTSSLVDYGTNYYLGAYAVSTSSVNPLSYFSYTTDAYHPQMLLAVIAVVLTFVVYLIARPRSKSPVMCALLLGSLFFLAATVLACGVNWNNFKMALSFLWARLWMIGSEDAMQAHLTAAIANLGIGKVFTRGFDFSGFTEEGGNIALVAATSTLTYLYLFIADADSTIVAVANENGEEAPADSEAMPLLLNGAANVVCAVVAASPVALGKESVAGAQDRGKSGLASIVASVMFLVSAVVWVIPALFATMTSYSISFNMYGHYGYTLQLLSQCSFQTADAVMMIVGISMVLRSLSIDVRDATQAAPFAATVAATFLFTNLAAGVAAGCVAFVLANLSAPKRRKGQPKSTLLARVGGVGPIASAVVGVALLVLLMW